MLSSRKSTKKSEPDVPKVIQDVTVLESPDDPPAQKTPALEDFVDGIIKAFAGRSLEWNAAASLIAKAINRKISRDEAVSRVTRIL